jgi:hypothetical protein
MSDIFDQSENAVETKPEYATWGQVYAEFYEAIYDKSSRAFERFDANVHKVSDKFIRAEITIIPLDEMNARFNTEAKFSVTGYANREWAAVTLPSIKALGISLRDLSNKWVKVTRKSNGKFYEKKTNGVASGEKKELTDFLFSKVFESQDACLQDYLIRSGEPVTQQSADAFPVDSPAQDAQPSMVADAILLKFASAIVTSAVTRVGKDMLKVSDLVKSQIDNNQMFAGKITSDSAEVIQMIIQACA